jgi:hypothetical protein
MRHVKNVEMLNASKILVGKHEGKGLRGIFSCKFEGNLDIASDMKLLKPSGYFMYRQV